MSYSSVLHQSVSKRRDALYKSRALDIERWMDLVTEAKSLKREISKIAEDYDDNEREREEEEQERILREEDGESMEDAKAADETSERLSKKQKETAKDVSSVSDL